MLLPSNQSAGWRGRTGVADPRAFCRLSTQIFLSDSRVADAVKRGKNDYKFIGVKQMDLNHKVNMFYI